MVWRTCKDSGFSLQSSCVLCVMDARATGFQPVSTLPTSSQPVLCCLPTHFNWYCVSSSSSSVPSSFWQRVLFFVCQSGCWAISVGGIFQFIRSIQASPTERWFQPVVIPRITTRQQKRGVSTITNAHTANMKGNSWSVACFSNFELTKPSWRYSGWQHYEFDDHVKSCHLNRTI